LIGLFDDLFHLNAWHKLFGEIAAATAAYFAGVHVVTVGGAAFSNWWSLPLTILWLVGCCNAINLIDGVDGLAAGVSLVATSSMLMAAILQHNVLLAYATVPLVGCLLGFLRYNFAPATVFLGDCGSLTIGFLLGCYGVLWSQKSATILGMAAPVLALSIPLLDTSLAIVRRFLRRQPIFGADRGHIHHRLLDLGHSPRTVTLLLWAVCALASICSLCLSNNQLEIPVVLVFGIATWFGIRRLGYIEFDTAGKMLVRGSFRQLLCSQIALQNLESKLEATGSMDDCWNVLESSYRDFGLCSLEMQVLGRTYRTGIISEETPNLWRIEIPLSGRDYIVLTHQFDVVSTHTPLPLMPDILRRTLEAKRLLFSRLAEERAFSASVAQ
jgi:UDP-GlcNAc:undecaprenyl-phosphate GlcNAc-1-phosphate transferase